MGKYTLGDGTTKNSTKLPTHVKGSSVSDDNTGVSFRTVTFTSAVGQQETFTMEFRPSPPFSAAQVLDAEASTFTETAGGITITCQSMTLSAAGTTEFRVQASGSGQVGLVVPPVEDPINPGNEAAVPQHGEGDGDDDVPIKIRAVVVHPTA